MNVHMKRLMMNWSGCFSLIAVFLFVPVPMTTGKVTSARWLYNIWDEHEKKDEANTLASINRDVQIITESRKDSKIQDYRFQMLLYEIQMERLGKSGNQEDSKKIDKLERRIDKMIEKLDTEGIDLDDIRSQTNMLFIVNR